MFMLCGRVEGNATPKSAPKMRLSTTAITIAPSQPVSKDAWYTARKARKPRMTPQTYAEEPRTAPKKKETPSERELSVGLNRPVI